MSSKRRLRVLVLAGLVSAVILVAQVSPWTGGDVDGKPADVELRTSEPSWSSPTGRFILGDYGSPVLRVGDPGVAPVIDAEATIGALKAAHVNTYAYLICPDTNADPRVSLSQWQQLPDFAQRAGIAGIDVFVYLVPPTEAAEATYEPFHWDYVAWFDQISRIASRERAIKGIIIDDFGGNVVARPNLGFHFTVPYVEDMMAAAHRHVPTLSFLPVLYHHDMVGNHAVLSVFRRQAQGVVFPYFGYSDGRRVPGNTRDATQAMAQGLEVSDLLSCPGGKDCRQIVFPARTDADRTTDAATWASNVIPHPNERRTISFAVNDDGGPLEPDSSYRIQVLAGGTSVRSVSRGNGWHERIFDVTAATSNHANTALELRITRPLGISKNRITVQVGPISVHGMSYDGGFAEPALTTVGVSSTSISDLPLIFMPYARPLTAERGWGASPEYFQSVLNQIGMLRAQGRLAGALVFKLPLGGAVLGGPSTHYQILARSYAQWLPR